MKPVPEFVLIESGPHDGRAVALLLRVVTPTKFWVLKWRSSKRAFVKHPQIERGKLRPAPWNDPRAQAALAAYERGEANAAIERLKRVLEVHP